MADYHGPKPITKSDMKMAKKHLKGTQDLLEDKIDDHENAKEDAQEAGNQQSVKYNTAHLQGHKKDLSQVNKSLKTVKNMKPAVIMPVQKSAGLTSVLTKKKVLAKAISKG